MQALISFSERKNGFWRQMTAGDFLRVFVFGYLIHSKTVLERWKMLRRNSVALPAAAAFVTIATVRYRTIVQMSKAEMNFNTVVSVYRWICSLQVLLTGVHNSEARYGSISDQTNDHALYARNAQPYGNQVYDKSLPFVPRYRYNNFCYLICYLIPLK